MGVGNKKTNMNRMRFSGLVFITVLSPALCAIILGQSACIMESSWCSFMGLATNSGLVYTFTFNNNFGDKSFRIMTTRMNDNMNPDTAKSNVETFLRSYDTPLLIVAEVGTGTSLNAMTATIGKIPFVAPVSGSRHLRFPFQ